MGKIPQGPVLPSGPALPQGTALPHALALIWKRPIVAEE